jgi:hypothetical protein
MLYVVHGKHVEDEGAIIASVGQGFSSSFLLSFQQETHPLPSLFPFYYICRWWVSPDGGESMWYLDTLAKGSEVRT